MVNTGSEQSYKTGSLLLSCFEGCIFILVISKFLANISVAFPLLKKLHQRPKTRQMSSHHRTSPHSVHLAGDSVSEFNTRAI